MCNLVFEVTFNAGTKKIEVTDDIELTGITTAVTYKILLKCSDAINYDQSADYFVNIIASDSDNTPIASPQDVVTLFFKTTTYDYTVDATKFTDETTITRDKLTWTTIGGSAPDIDADRFSVAPLGSDDT